MEFVTFGPQSSSVLLLSLLPQPISRGRGAEILTIKLLLPSRVGEGRGHEAK
jgi:hypothetical protein